MEILLFGRLADPLGRQVSVEVAGDGCSVAELRARIAETFPALDPGILSPRVRACVADSIVADDYRLDADGTVEFLPQVSGG